MLMLMQTCNSRRRTRGAPFGDAMIQHGARVSDKAVSFSFLTTVSFSESTDPVFRVCVSRVRVSFYIYNTVSDLF